MSEASVVPVGLILCIFGFEWPGARSFSDFPPRDLGGAFLCSWPGAPVVPFYQFLFWGFPGNRLQKNKGTLIPTSLLEDLVGTKLGGKLSFFFFLQGSPLSVVRILEGLAVTRSILEKMNICREGGAVEELPIGG